MNQKTLKLILSEMKNLLILILAIAIASCGNSKKNKEYFPLTILQLGFQDLSRENG